MKSTLVTVITLALLPAYALAADNSSPQEALAWFHALPKLGGMVNKGLDPERFAKLTSEDLKSLKQVQLGGHIYLSDGKLGGHLVIPDSDYRHLTALPALEALKFPENNLGDEALVHIGRIPTLKSLQLMENKITNDGLKHLTGLKQLTHLDLRWNQQLDDSCIVQLVQLANLQELNLFKTKVSEEGVKRIEKALPNCKVIVTKQ